MQMVMGAWVSSAISGITRLHIPDLLAEHGPCTAAQLVERSAAKLDAGALERALRACASLGLFSESAEGVFGLTPLSEVLTRRSPASVKGIAEMFGASWWKVWGGFAEAVETGASQATAQLGMEYWEYCNANPAELLAFGEAMKSNSHRSTLGLLAHCDFSGAQTVVDIAGGLGHLAVALLERYPNLRGVLLDLPTIAPLAKRHLDTVDAGVRERVEICGGDMFESVPPGDVYVMKHIIHDWDDARCIKLLNNCRASMIGSGRVICVDAVLPAMGDTTATPAKLLDLNMLVSFQGKERTRTQWEGLYAAAGMKIESVTPLQDNFGTSIIVGTLV
ncbi:O-methyltransferase [Enhygromyxa salina]|uniref:O-methyltransferase n=2 Tax=Enhygromyxa salina TaxID=215803 RepID=A0A0C2CVC0_9BACT|nr:O-methyltransferase [Enhygromyxa salina]